MDLEYGTFATISDLQRAEVALAIRLRYEAGLSAFSTALIEASPGDLNTIHQALHHLLAAADSSRVYIAENFVDQHEDGTTCVGMKLIYEACVEGIEPEIDNPALQHGYYHDGFQRWYDTLSQGLPIAGLVTNFPDSERIFLQLQSITSILVLPIFMGGSFYGFIGFDHVQAERVWEENDVRLLRTAGEILSAHLQRQRAAAELVRKYEQLRAVFVLSETAARAGSLSDIYTAALNALHQALGADRASVLLFDTDGVMRFKATLGLSATYCEAVEGHTPWAPDTYGPEPVLSANIIVDHTMAAPLPRTGEPLRDVVAREGILALGMIPLVFQGRLLGKFMVYYDSPHQFPPEEIQFMQTLASTLANAIGRKHAGDALRQSEQRYRLFMQNFTGIAYQIEWGSSHPTLFEGTVPEIIGYTAEAILSGEISWADLMDQQDRERVLALGHWLFDTTGSSTDDEYRVLHKSGEMRWVRDIARHVVDEENERNFIQGAIYDMTERKRAEEEQLEMERRLFHAQKLESLGVLAGGIAHDFNNLLLAISGNLEVAQLHIGPDAPAAPFIERAMNAIHSAAGLAQQMLDYSGRGHFIVEPLDLNLLVEQNCEFVRAAIARSRVLELQLASNIPAINADSSQIQQVIMNLITNAAEATADVDGKILVSTGVAQYDAAYLALSRGVEKPPPGLFAYFQVEDNGSGMSAEVQQRLFEPFYTTKFTGRGLGMAAVLGIVRGHHGAIVVESNVNEGTCVRVLFPLPVKHAQQQVEEPAVKELEDADAIVAAAPGGRVVLVADDEPLVHSMCRALLEEWGVSGAGCC